MLVGFDARKGIEGPSNGRTDGTQLGAGPALSTDQRIWPSTFSEAHTYHYAIPEYCGPYESLWEDLDVLNSFLETHSAAFEKPYVVIAVDVLDAQGSWDEAQRRWLSTDAGYDRYLPSRMPHAAPAELQPNWELLGYDVSDCFLQSARLCVCEGRCDEAKVSALAGKLNEHHLFDCEKDADAYRAYCNQTFKTHGPFFVFGIYQVRWVG